MGLKYRFLPATISGVCRACNPASWAQHDQLGHGFVLFCPLVLITVLSSIHYSFSHSVFTLFWILWLLPENLPEQSGWITKEKSKPPSDFPAFLSSFLGEGAVFRRTKIFYLVWLLKLLGLLVGKSYLLFQFVFKERWQQTKLHGRGHNFPECKSHSDNNSSKAHAGTHCDEIIKAPGKEKTLKTSRVVTQWVSSKR